MSAGGALQTAIAAALTNVEALTGVPEEDWLFETNGPGIMVAEPKVFGRVYLHDPHGEEDLLFVARAD